MIPKAAWSKWSLVLILIPFASPSLSQAYCGPDTPFLVNSQEKRGLLIAEISSTIDFSFDAVSEALAAPAAWCEFIPLIFNVKACTYEQQEDRAMLTFYIARRFHDPIAQTISLRYRFEIQEDASDRTLIVLTAPHGPHGTRDYRIELDLRPADGDKTELLLHSSFRPSFRSRLATRAYLRGAGRDKVGFSVERYRRGEPVLVGGIQGIVERNAMRHYLALTAFLETLHLPEEERFEASLHAWFEATEDYPRQLYEMERDEYLSAKRRERETQEAMQERIDGARQ